jgi:hypothetical protein
VRLRLLLDDPSILHVLPASLTSGRPNTGPLETLKRGLMAGGPWLLALGAALFLVAGLRSARIEEQT